MPKIEPTWSDSSASMANDHLLVILNEAGSGNNGFMLESSRLSIGSGESDDVYLSAVGIVPSHLKLVFINGLMTILSAAQKIRVDGKEVISYPVDVQPLQVLSLSPDMHLSYGKKGDTWPAPIPWEISMVVEPERVKKIKVEEKKNSYLHPKEIMQSKHPVAYTMRIAGGVIGVAILMTFLMHAADYFTNKKAVVNPGDVAIDRSASFFEKIKQEDPDRYGGLYIERRGDGALSIKGLIATNEDYRRLASEVRLHSVTSSGNVRLDAMTKDRFIELVNDLISRYPIASHIESDAEGLTIRLFGIKTSAIDLDRLMNELEILGKRIEPKKLKVFTELRSFEQVFDDLSRKFTESPLTKDFQIVLTDRGVRVTGTVAPSAEDISKKITDEVMSEYKEQIPLEFDVKVDRKLNFNLVGLTLDGVTSMATLMQKGRIDTFRIGESVFDAGDLKEIKLGGVILSIGKREIFIPMRQR